MIGNKYLKTIFILDVSNQTNLLLNNLKLIVDKLQSEKAYLKTQVEKLKTEKEQLVISNYNLTNKISMLEKDMLVKVFFKAFKALKLILKAILLSYCDKFKLILTKFLK